MASDAESPSVESTDSTSSSSILPNTSNTPKSSTMGSTDIIQNMNAQSVTPQLISIASNIVGENNMCVAKTFEDAKLAARTVVRGCHSVVTANGEHIWNSNDDEIKSLKNYPLVIPVEGNETLSGWINTMVDDILLLLLSHKLEHDAEGNDADSSKNNETTANNETSNMSIKEALQ